MKKRALLAVASMLLIISFAALLGSCSSSSSSDTAAPPAATTGKVVGKVSSNLTGTAIANAMVTAGTVSAVTGSDGTYLLDNMAVSNNTILTISASGYAFTSKIASVTAGNTSRVDVALQPVAASVSIASLATATLLTVPASSAAVQLEANALVTALSGTPAYPVTASITPIDPSSNPQLMPGNFTTSTGSRSRASGRWK